MAIAIRCSQDDDNEDDGDEPGNGRLPARRRGRGGAGGSDYDDPDDPDDDEEDDADDDADSRFDHDSRMRGSMRGKPFPSSKHNRAMMKNAHGGDGSRDRFGGGEMGVGKDGGRSSGKMSGRYVGHDKGRARGKSEQDKARERGRGSVDQSRGGKGDNFMPGGKAKGGDADQGGSRTKRKDFSNALGAAGDSDDKLGSGSLCREKDRGDRFKDKSGAGGSKKVSPYGRAFLTQLIVLWAFQPNKVDVLFVCHALFNFPAQDEAVGSKMQNIFLWYLTSNESRCAPIFRKENRQCMIKRRGKMLSDRISVFQLNFQNCDLKLGMEKGGLHFFVEIRVCS